MHELRHWPSTAGMSSQSHCGDEEDGRHRIVFMTPLHMYYTLALCLLSTLFVIEPLQDSLVFSTKSPVTNSNWSVDIII